MTRKAYSDIDYCSGSVMKVIGAKNDDHYNDYLIHMGEYCEICWYMKKGIYTVRFENGDFSMMNIDCLEYVRLPLIKSKSVIIATKIENPYPKVENGTCFCEVKTSIGIVYQTSDLEKYEKLGYKDFKAVSIKKVKEILNMKDATDKEVLNIIELKLKK